MTRSFILTEALAALERGWALTPLRGKTPILDAWQTRARPTPEDVVAWTNAGLNLGLRTGPVSGVLVVDHDPRHDDGTPLPELPITVRATTGGGGTHHYYRSPEIPPPNSNRRIHPALDVKSLGGQAVFVGSIHPDTGRPYAWTPGFGPGDVSPVDVPPELLARMRVATDAPTPAVVAVREDAALRRASAYLARVPGGVSGAGGSRPCFRAACVLVHGFGLSQEEALALLVNEYSPRCTPPWSEKELRHKVADAARQPGVRGFGQRVDAQGTSLAPPTDAATPPRIVLPRRVSRRTVALLNTGVDARYSSVSGALDVRRAAFGAAISLLRAGMDARSVVQALWASALRGHIVRAEHDPRNWLSSRVSAAAQALRKESSNA